MAEKIIAKIQFKRGEGAPPTLDVGEPGYDTQNNKVYMGKGAGQQPIEMARKEDIPENVTLPEFKTINGESVVGSGNIQIESEPLPSFKTINNESIIGSGDINISALLEEVKTSFKQVAGPIPLSELSGKKIVCFGDSITQGTSLGDPETAKDTDSTGQKFPAITNEELAASIPVGTRGKSYPHYLGLLGTGASIENLGTGGWCLPTGGSLSSKIDGFSNGVQTATSNIHNLKSKYETEPYAILVMFGVNEFTRHYPLGNPSNLRDMYVLEKLPTYSLTYVKYRENSIPEDTNSDPCYVDGDGNIVATYNSSTETYTGISTTTIDDENQKIYVLTDTIYGAWEYTALRLKKDFLTTKIIFMTPPTFRQAYTVDGHATSPQGLNKAGYYFSDLVTAIAYTALYYQIPVIDHYNVAGITLENAWNYIGDGCHLNYKGGIYFAKNILEFLLLNPVVLSTKWLQPGLTVDSVPIPQNPTDPGTPTVSVTDVTLSQSTLNIAVGETLQLVATVSPANATNKQVNYSSNDSGVATVSGTGLVTAISSGQTTITCTTVDGSKTATCSVTVSTVSTYTTYDATQLQTLTVRKFMDGSIPDTGYGTITNNTLEITGTQLKDTMVYINVPLTLGSEVYFTMNMSSGGSANVAFGLETDIAPTGNIIDKRWKVGENSIYIPESHTWADGTGKLYYLQRGTGAFKNVNPGITNIGIVTEGQLKLVVEQVGFSLYLNDVKLGVLSGTGGNHYITNSTLPAYFAIGAQYAQAIIYISSIRVKS